MTPNESSGGQARIDPQFALSGGLIFSRLWLSGEPLQSGFLSSRNSAHLSFRQHPTDRRPTADATTPLRFRSTFGAYLARFCFMMAMLPFWFLTSQAMQQFLGFSPLMAGIVFFPLTILNFIVAMRVADLTERFGNGPLLGIGMALTVIGLLIMALLSPVNGYWLELGLPMLLIGFGQGLIMSPLTTVGVANTLPEDAGAASGLINTMHQIGSSVGLALIVGVTGGMTHGVTSYRQSLLMSTICVTVALIIIVFVVIPGERRENQLKLKR